jgi:hypothetical protein
MRRFWSILIVLSFIGIAACAGGNLCKSGSPAFRLDNTKMWKCQSDSIECYNRVTQQVVENLRSATCKNATCLAPSDQKYSTDLRKTLYDSISRAPQSVPAGICPVKWTDEMEYSASTVLQRSQQCQVDYVGLFTLFEMAQHLFKAELGCIKNGLKIQSQSSSDTLNSLLNAIDDSPEVPSSSSALAPSPTANPVVNPSYAPASRLRV